jgi:hypothetical protein
MNIKSTSVTESGHLITQEMYDKIFDIASQPKQNKYSLLNCHYKKNFTAGSSMAGVCLYRDGKVVAMVEQVFHIIQEDHQSISTMLQ